jgi:energy-coupling factor transport system ATP-binding protein
VLRKVSTSSTTEATSSTTLGLAHITAMTGPNGSGKTTALMARALADPTRVALVPEYLSDFFVRDSVASECSRSDHTAHVPPGTTLGMFTELLGQAEIAVSRHPRDLSAGQQLALAIAVQSVASPDELLIDEPTRGLDASMRLHLAYVLERCGMISRITIATHDSDFITLVNAQEVPA